MTVVFFTVEFEVNIYERWRQPDGNLGMRRSKEKQRLENRNERCFLPLAFHRPCIHNVCTFPQCVCILCDCFCMEFSFPQMSEICMTDYSYSFLHFTSAQFLHVEEKEISLSLYLHLGCCSKSVLYFPYLFASSILCLDFYFFVCLSLQFWRKKRAL